MLPPGCSLFPELRADVVLNFQSLLAKCPVHCPLLPSHGSAATGAPSSAHPVLPGLWGEVVVVVLHPLKAHFVPLPNSRGAAMMFTTSTSPLGKIAPADHQHPVCLHGQVQQTLKGGTGVRCLYHQEIQLCSKSMQSILCFAPAEDLAFCFAVAPPKFCLQ